MKSLIRKGLLILTLCALFIGIERLSHTLNGGFSPAAITSSLQPRPEWNITHEASDIAETLQALKQPYHYLGKGSQSFVFLSEDKKYVIKFFKHQRWRLPSMIEALPLPRVWEQKRERWKQKKQETVSDTFGSCASAYRDFKNETGLLFIHLNKTPPINQELVVTDRIGVKHRLSLGSIEFILQRRAVRTDTYLLQLKKRESSMKQKRRSTI